MGMGMGPELFFSSPSPSPSSASASGSGSALGLPSYAMAGGARGSVPSSGGGNSGGGDYANGGAVMTTWLPSSGGGGMTSPWRPQGQHQNQQIFAEPPGLGPSRSNTLTLALAQDQHFRSPTSPSTVEVRPTHSLRCDPLLTLSHPLYLPL
jgi:hypothetical protein